MDIAEALEIPLRERNGLLLSAGYAPQYAEGGWDAPQMQRIMAAVRRMLKQQEPYPAVLMDRYWNVLEANDAAPRFFGRFVDMGSRPRPRNILHLMFDPAGMRPFIADWERVSQSLLARVRREAVGGVIDTGTQALLDALTAYADAPPARGGQLADEALPIIPLSFDKDGTILNYFSMVSTVGTPTTVAAQELRVECMFPADDATEVAHLAILEGR